MFCSKKRRVYRASLDQDNPRGTEFIGVSRNGKKWQALILIGKKKRYLGSCGTIDEAARCYDINALLLHGLKVYDFDLMI